MDAQEDRGRLQATLAPVGDGYGTTGGREFLQERLALFNKVVLFLGGGFYLLVNLLSFASPQHSWSRWVLDPSNQLHLGTLGVIVGFWWTYRRRPLSSRLLRVLDGAGTILVSALFSLMGLTQEGPHFHQGAALSITNGLVARAVIVPSSPRFTLLVSAASGLCTVATGWLVFHRPVNAAIPYPPLMCFFYVLLWMAVAAAVSTVASRVIYGLREEVKVARRLGQYTLLEKIGEGGMGEVYKARHALLRRPTAVKLLRPGTAGEKSIARFEREVQLTCRLTHPNTIAIYDYGRTPDGIFYYAMEYLPGITLEALARRYGPQPPGRVIHILLQVCASLAEAHGGGLIHRDIKGANVILCRRGGVCDVAKVVDFGLVKDLGDLGDGSLSGQHAITGTPLYLSPEAIRSPEAVDARSDIYAVGVLGYLLLTGANLFEGKSFMEICGHHLHTTPTRPSVRLGKDLPPDLEAAVMACLEKDRARRPPDVAALSRSLRACAAAGSWTEQDAAAWWSTFEAQEEGRAVRSVEPTAKLGK